MVKMNEIEDLKFKPLPIGQYIAEITDVELKHSQNTEKPYYAITYSILNDEFRNAQVYQNKFFVSDDPEKQVTMDRMFRAYLKHVTGIKDSDEFNEKYGEVDTQVSSTIKETLIGSKVGIEIGHRPYNDQIYNEVKKAWKVDAENLGF